MADVEPLHSDIDGDRLATHENNADEHHEDIASPPTDDLDNVVEAIRRFAGNSAHTLLPMNGNINYSPASLWMALALASSGSNGRTRLELEATLHAENVTMDALHIFRNALNDTGSHQMADSLWTHAGFSIRNKWRTAIVSCGAEVFDDEPYNHDTGQRMSDWVHEHTHGMLSPKLEADPSQVMTLINALVSNGRWSSTFDEEDTYPEIFHGEHGDVTTPMMHQQSKGIGYARGDGWIKLTLPFTEDKGSVTIILPDDQSHFDRMLNDVTLFGEILDEPAKTSRQRQVNLTMPRFTAQSTFDSDTLKKQLNNLDIVQAFDPDLADFSSMSDGSLYIGQIIQETRMEVTEEGAKASAYTRIDIADGALPIKPRSTVEVRVDRPFIYTLDAYLPNSRDAVPLFLGVLRDAPNESER